MALTERDRNGKVMPKRKDEKRKRVEIDLTGDSDSDDQRASKVPKSTVTKNAERNSTSKQQGDGTSAYHTPPASSVPRSSASSFQNSNRSQYGYGSIQIPADSQHSQADRDAWLANDEDDEEDYFNELTPTSTQANAANTEQLHHYADLPTKIVGVQYYRGYANPGEQILMRREPGNPYDSNAIRVDNVARTQIGHIPRRIAAKLAKFMDNSYLHVEGELAGDIGTFDCPLTVHMYGPDPRSEEGVLLSAEMKAEKLPLNALKAAEQAEKQREKEMKEAEKRQQQEEKRRIAEARKAAAVGGSGSGARIPQGSQHGWTNQSQAGPSPTPVMSDILEASQRFNPRLISQATDQYGMKEDVLKDMPSMNKPKGIKTDMLPYQLQGVRWMLDQESPEPPPYGSKEAVQLWKRNDRNHSLFTNLATTFSTKEEPVLASGGILADDMGLGKTLEVLALLVADCEKAGQKPGPTLIVAPLSVMSNWTSQAAQHISKEHALNVYIYHGTGRVHMKAADFAQYDIVLTTYQTLSSDYMPKSKSATGKQPERRLRSSGLYSMDWRRVVLDEGHQIRNSSSKGAAAVTALMAKSRWVLTGMYCKSSGPSMLLTKLGTPIVNSLRDLYCLLRFIGITGGLEELEIFNRVLIRPLKQSDPSAIFLLQAIMTAFTLRRRKEMKFIDLRLPTLDEYVHRIDFTGKERERYDALNAEAQGLLTRYEKKAGQTGKGAGEAFQHLLEILLRMRQCCNHWQLCGERITNLLAQLQEQKTVDLTPENKKALQDILQMHIESQEDCPICMETLHEHEPVITTCSHVFCRMCIVRTIETQQKCPMCRAELKDDSVLVSPANECGDVEADDEMDLTQSSTKLDSMMEILEASKASADKTVIFSQWTRFLDIVQARLDRDGFKYSRIDGTMNAQARDASLRALDEDPECTILLASLGVGAVGLNLTAANQVILSDTWWSPAIEDQAVDRVHRLGQKKETRVFRLVMDNTIEEQTIEVQKEKRKLMQLAFAEREGKRDKAKTGRLADIQRLLRGAGSSNPISCGTGSSNPGSRGTASSNPK